LHYIFLKIAISIIAFCEKIEINKLFIAIYFNIGLADEDISSITQAPLHHPDEWGERETHQRSDRGEMRRTLSRREISAPHANIDTSPWCMGLCCCVFIPTAEKKSPT
jgi:hypothetical protein